MGLKRLLPWWAKIAVKIVLSRAHLDYGWWQRRGLFVHGQMDRPAYAFRVVMSHLERLGWTTLNDKVVLELGPGDSLATAVIASSLGAERCYLCDAGPFARQSPRTYVHVQEYLEAKGLKPPDLRSCESLDDVLARCNSIYLADGLNGLARIPSQSVDLVFSQAVLEHVRLADFAETQKELARVLCTSGVASHQVDLKDHLAGALNSLRFDDQTWEAEWMAQSGFYTNRLRFSEIVDSLEAAGLESRVTDIQRWDSLPVPRAKLAARFRSMNDEELCVKQFDVLARPAEVRA